MIAFEYYCTTNLDDYKQVEWPHQFLFPPRIGDRILSVDGRRSLKVVGIEHCQEKDGGKKPYVKVELHK